MTRSITDKLFFKLQLRFTIMVTAICSLLIAVAFGAFILVNIIVMETDVGAQLGRGLALSSDVTETVAKNSCECAIVVVRNGVTKTVYTANINEVDLGAVVTRARSGVSDVTTTISGKHYRIASRFFDSTGGVTMYVVYDYTARFEYFIVQTVTIGFSFLALVVFFGLMSYLISGHMLSPAHEAFIKQKDLVANASHELKTPIATIKANMGALRADSSATVAENTKWLDEIDAQTEKMHALVQEMLQLSSFESVGYTPMLTDFDLGALVEGYCLSAEATCYEKGITLALESDAELIVHSDENMWGKLVGLLFDNAVKYANQKGEITVKVRCETVKKKRTALLEISNTGKDIPPDEIGLIFERFHKIGNNPDSFGLGLAMAKTIVETLGGGITVKSENGLTTFSAYTPC